MHISLARILKMLILQAFLDKAVLLDKFLFFQASNYVSITNGSSEPQPSSRFSVMHHTAIYAHAQSF